MARLWGRLMHATTAGFAAFRAEMMSTGPRAARTGDDFMGWTPRKARSALAWALYDGSAYDDGLPWSASFREAYGIYPGTRAVANPVARLVDFYVGHLLGGDLDPQAGDGAKVPSCLPILLGDGAPESLRKAIARFWRDNQFAEVKDRIGLVGAVESLVAAKVVDDKEGGRVRVEIYGSSELADISFNPSGTVALAYDLRKLVDDPLARPESDGSRPRVEYRETALRTAAGVRYQTFKDNVPYGWSGKPPGWDEDTPFVPLVVARFRDLGRGRAVNCFHSAVARIVEVDQQVSILSDANRKALRMPMMFAGVDGLPGDEDGRGDDADDETERGRWRRRHNPGRFGDEVESFSVPNPLAKAWHLRYGIDAAGAIAHNEWLSTVIAKDYPELRADPAAMAGTPTAEAIRSARVEATKRVNARRVGFHALVVRVNQMAVAIGGARGHDGYAGFDFGSFDRRELDHSIGPVPVFEDSEADRLASAASQAAIIASLVGSNAPLEWACKIARLSDDQIALLKATPPAPAPSVAAP